MLVGLIIALTIALLSANCLKGLIYRVPCQTKHHSCYNGLGKILSSTVTLQQEQMIYNTGVRTARDFVMRACAFPFVSIFLKCLIERAPE